MPMMRNDSMRNKSVRMSTTFFRDLAAAIVIRLTQTYKIPYTQVFVLVEFRL